MFLRLIGYIWASPNTLIGLLGALAAYATGGHVRVVAGVLEVEGGITSRMLAAIPFLPSGAAAITLGHVVLAQRTMFSAMLRVHERVHVSQYEIWGPFFLPAYCVSSLWAYATGRDPYRDNVFEREAFNESDVLMFADTIAERW